jgi:lipase
MLLHTERFGPADGPPLVALHGVRGHGGRWAGLADELPGLRVVAPDLRGHGRSGGEAPWTLERHAADVLATLDEQGLGRAPVLGHSFGGAVALHLALLAPERVSGLILLDPGIELRPEVAAARAAAALTPPDYGSPAEAVVDRAQTWPPAARDLAAREVESHLHRAGDGRWRWRFSVPAVVTAYSELARPAVTPPPGVPTLLVVAEQHDAVHPDYPDACRAALGDRFRLVVLDCGHLIPLERPADTGRLIREFLA